MKEADFNNFEEELEYYKSISMKKNPPILEVEPTRLLCVGMKTPQNKNKLMHNMKTK